MLLATASGGTNIWSITRPCCFVCELVWAVCDGARWTQHWNHHERMCLMWYIYIPIRPAKLDRRLVGEGGGCSLRAHFEFTLGPLRAHFEFTSSSLQFHFGFTSMSLRFHFEFTSISLRFHFYFTLISLRCNFGVTWISL